MTLKRFTVFISSALLALPLYKIVQACADGGDYEGASSFFANDITAKPAYKPFYYIDGPKYYDDAWYNTPDTLPDANIEEWAGYTANTVSHSDLDSFIYGASYDDLKSLYGNIEKGAPLSMNAKFTGNGLTRWFRQSKDLEALGYLMYAKQCQPYATSADEWTKPVMDTARMACLAKNGQQLYAVAKNALIKDKYAFQILRLSFYSGKNAQAVKLFDELIEEHGGGGYIYNRCLELKAGALFRQKKKAEAAYLYSKVFDQSDYLKKSAYLSFDWCVGQDAAPALKLCKTPHERAVVWLMNGLHQYEDGLPSLDAAYQADPAIAGLDVLMTREINKLEQRYQMPALYAERSVNGQRNAFYGTQDKTELEAAQKYTQYLPRLNAFTQKVLADKKANNPAFWALSSSYLYFMQRNVADCKRMMEVAKSGRMSLREQDMYHTLQILYAVRSNGKMTPQLEAQLLPDMKWLRGQREQLPFRYAMNTLLTTAYLKGGDTVKAIYTLGLGTSYGSTDFTDDAGNILEYMTIPKLQEVQAFAAKKDKTPFERLLTDSSIYTAARLYELEGTKYLRKHQFAKAIAPLEKSDHTPLFPDPFKISISEKMTWPEEDSAHLVSKLDFAGRMAGLEVGLSKAPDDAALLMAYATGLYSMTYYGNAYHAYTYYRSSSDGRAYFNSADRAKLPPEEQEFYGAMKAEATFVKAALKAKNKEQQAKALFMAAKCWQKRCPGGPYSFYEEQQLKLYYANCLKNPYFLQLAAASAKTSFYEEAIGTCGYFQDYAKRK